MVIRKILFLSLFIIVFSFQEVLSQPVKIEARLDTNSILIGDQLNLNIKINLPSKASVRWPLIGDTILGHIRVINRTRIDTTYSPDHKLMTLHQGYLLTSFDSGFYAIPPIPFYTRELPDTSFKLAETETLLLSVHTLPVDTTQAIKPIKGPIKIPITFREVAPWILLGILIVLLGYFSVIYYRRRKKAEPIFQIKPRVKFKPYEIALMNLEKLRAKKLWQSGKVKEFHTELTEILRIFLEEQFGTMAMEQTSDEIISSLTSKSALNQNSIDDLRKIFTLADLVKFAKAIPSPSDHEKSTELAVRFVNDTIVQQNELPELEEQPAGLKNNNEKTSS
jgi:hypothetical protein